jgi:hypothetical protein
MTDNRLVRLSGVTKQPRKYLWPDRIPLSAITDFFGNPGTGKSTILNDLSAKVTTGDPMPGCTESCEPAGVVMLQGEDSLADDVVPSLQAAGADLNRIFAFNRSAETNHPLLLPNDLPSIEAAIKAVNAKLLIIDPVAYFFGVSMNNDQSVRKALGPLSSLASLYELAVVVVRHPTKNGRSNPLYRGAGSIGISGSVRSGMMVGDDPASTSEYEHVLALYKGSRSSAAPLAYRTVRGGDGMITVEWLGESPCSVHDLTVGGTKLERTKVQEAMEVLGEILRDGPVRAKEVVRLAAEATVSQRTLERAKSLLCVESDRIGGGPEAIWYWVAPDGLDRLVERLIYGLPPSDPTPNIIPMKPFRDSDRASDGELK